ncbi:uncharacterized protein HKW66_Vig0239310 [Vigna angularis]|uniref:Uncharacterized protein n=1 Tax=Phaseolus angularis TaxID=3914 RepID=A0A8T0KSP7_PHAAN|nr:uncharacterized protein HKW66_Vig0239310 [Vigna angularis]
MLAQKPYEVLGIQLLYKIWDEVKYLTDAMKLKIDDILALTTQPSVDSNGRNLVHLFFLYRRLEFFEELLNKTKQNLLRAVDNEGNNVLHLAALLPPEFKSFSGDSAKIQMRKELSWFQVNRVGQGDVQDFVRSCDVCEKNNYEATRAGLIDSRFQQTQISWHGTVTPAKHYSWDLKWQDGLYWEVWKTIWKEMDALLIPSNKPLVLNKPSNQAPLCESSDDGQPLQPQNEVPLKTAYVNGCAKDGDGVRE